MCMCNTHYTCANVNRYSQLLMLLSRPTFWMRLGREGATVFLVTRGMRWIMGVEFLRLHNLSQKERSGFGLIIGPVGSCVEERSLSQVCRTWGGIVMDLTYTDIYSSVAFEELCFGTQWTFYQVAELCTALGDNRLCLCDMDLSIHLKFKHKNN